MVRPLTYDDPARTQQILGAILAHELRTPMTTIFGGAQLVANPSVSSETRAEAASSVAREAQHMYSVIEDLLVFVGHGRRAGPELGPVLLRRVIPGTVNALRFFQPDVRVDTDVPPDLPPVLGSEADLEHVIRNFLSHAIRYSPPDGAVLVRGAVSRGEVHVRVLDEGPGRTPDEAAAAYDLFSRSARSTADPSGANLGLVVARLLVERSNGRIWAGGPTGGELGFALRLAE